MRMPGREANGEKDAQPGPALWARRECADPDGQASGSAAAQGVVGISLNGALGSQRRSSTTRVPRASTVP